MTKAAKSREIYIYSPGTKYHSYGIFFHNECTVTGNCKPNGVFFLSQFLMNVFVCLYYIWRWCVLRLPAEYGTFYKKRHDNSGTFYTLVQRAWLLIRGKTHCRHVPSMFHVLRPTDGKRQKPGALHTINIHKEHRRTVTANATSILSTQRLGWDFPHTAATAYYSWGSQ